MVEAARRATVVGSCVERYPVPGFVIQAPLTRPAPSRASTPSRMYQGLFNHSMRPMTLEAPSTDALLPDDAYADWHGRAASFLLLTTMMLVMPLAMALWAGAVAASPGPTNERTWPTFALASAAQPAGLDDAA